MMSKMHATANRMPATIVRMAANFNGRICDAASQTPAITISRRMCHVA